MSSGDRTEPAWGELWQAFHRLVETPGRRDRENILAELGTAIRSEVLELLAAHEGRGEDLATPLPEAPPDRLLGQYLGPYQVLRWLGEGGMGAVYLAEQSQPVHRRVVLKVMRDEAAAQEAKLRFEAERQVLVMMNHPHVATAYGAGTTQVDGRPVAWLAMEWIPGLPIDVFCKRFRLSQDARRRLLLQALSGLAHAHRKAIVHRDIKASNVMVTVRDHEAVAKVIDFGIAKSLGASVVPAAAKTRFGTPVGTPGAMSPEQAAGDVTVEASSDVYSLGLLAARLLHPREEPSEGASARLERVLERATHHDPTRRYRDAAAFAEALEATPNTADPAKTERRKATDSRRFWPLAALFLLATAATVFWFSRPGPDQERDPRQGSAKAAQASSRPADALPPRQAPIQSVPIAVTFDDLPAAGITGIPELRAMTADLLATLEAFEIPAYGFVNSDKVDLADRQTRLEILREWLDAGHDLGNHGAGHLSLSHVSVERYLADIEKCEPVLHEVLGERGKEPRYFRHPFLRTGLDIDSKNRVEAWLEEHDYRVAPVTQENVDWLFAAVYQRRLRALDQEGADKIAQAYLEYTDRLFEFWEKVSLRLHGDTHPHVFLVHANKLNADYFDEVAEIIKRRGYHFATLDEVLSHPIYESPDTWVGEDGMIWQFRWAETAGLDIDWRLEPEPPEWVVQAFESSSG